MWGYHRRDRPVRRGDGAAGLLDHQRLRPLAGRVALGRPATAWGPLNGSLLNLSYGYGKIFVVPHEMVGGQMQGGDVRPADPAVPDRRDARPVPPRRRPALRLRHVRLGRQPDPARRLLPRPRHGQADVPAGRPERPQGRHGDPLHRPARPEPLPADPSRYAARIWSIKRTVNYGSDHHDERPLEITSASLSADGRTVLLEIPGAPADHGAWRSLTGSEERGGEPVDGTIHNTIHRLGNHKS